MRALNAAAIEAGVAPASAVTRSVVPRGSARRSANSCPAAMESAEKSIVTGSPGADTAGRPAAASAAVLQLSTCATPAAAAVVEVGARADVPAVASTREKGTASPAVRAVTTRAPPVTSAETRLERTGSALMRAAISVATSAPAVRAVSTIAADEIANVPDNPRAPEVANDAFLTWARATSSTSMSWEPFAAVFEAVTFTMSAACDSVEEDCSRRAVARRDVVAESVLRSKTLPDLSKETFP